MLGTIIKTALGFGLDFITAKRKKALVKAEAESEIIKTLATSEHRWDYIAMMNSGNSWKDEWVTILFTLPVFFAFIPGAEPFIQNGFRILSESPEWYRWFLGTIVAGSFGMRSVAKAMINNKAK